MSTRLHSAWLLAPLAILMTTVLATSGARADGTLAGSQGTDTSLPATASQVTVKGSGTFADLTITINQTANLTDQAVSITWTGGSPTRPGPGRFGSQYLQIMQCWGEDDGSVPSNPGPPPEQCEQGAVGGTYEGVPIGVYPNEYALTRIISQSSWPNFTATRGYLDKRTAYSWLPFRAVDGTEVNAEFDPTFNPGIVGGNYWLNPYFNQVTTNEIAGAATGPDGKGAELFETLTGVQSSGLGCGQHTQPVPGSDKKIPRCWIVIVPRGTPADEDKGSGIEPEAATRGVATSPLSTLSWQNRIAIPIDFNPVDSPCVLGSDERSIAGSELVLPAVVSWQPNLCASQNLPPFSYALVSDGSARQQLVAHQQGAPGMAVVSQPLAAAALDPASPVVYAPLSSSGLVIGFNIERNASLAAPADSKLLNGVRIADMNLTPRLVAKLLTQSYRQAVDIVGQAPPGYGWDVKNPGHLGLDPDFVQFNPEFGVLQITDGRPFSSLQLPAGNSDAAQQVWKWIVADPEAKAWLDGTPDEWGMKVNPVYSTNTTINPTGIGFGDPTPTSFPKADPYCYQAPSRGVNGSLLPPPLCGTDWLPYKRSLAEAAQAARIASDGAKVVDNPNAVSSADVWKRDVPQYLGRRGMLALTDTPSSAQYGLQTARLSRAGDGGPRRAFVAADTAGLTNGVTAMVAGATPSVLESSPLAVAPGAYPLTTMTYAALTPLALDQKARSDYAAFIDYAVGAGQVSGLELGQLPRGYSPLSDDLKAQSRAAADVVRTMVAPKIDPPPDPTTVPPTVTPLPTTTSVSSTTDASSPTTVESTSSAPTTPTTVPVPVTVANTTRAPAPKEPRQTTPNPSLPITARPTAQPTLPAAATTAPVAAVDSSTTAPRPASTSPLSTTTSLAPSPSTLAELQVSPPTPTVLTPSSTTNRSRLAVPGLGVVALGSALFALEITKRPGRKGAQMDDDDEADLL